MARVSPKAFCLALVFAITILGDATPVHAQYQVESWTTDDGLPQNTVHSILQTRDGYLWLTTQDGLVRYDGVRFTIFNKNNSKGIVSNRFTDLIVDVHDNLWIGTESNGVVRYKNGTFETHTIAGDSQREPRWYLALDHQGQLVASTQLGIIRWNGEKFVAQQSVASETKESTLLWGKSGAFWYANGKTLHRFKDGKSNDFSLPGSVNGLYEDRNGRLWIGTNTAGLSVLENNQLTLFTVKDGLPSNHTFPKAEDDSGNLWVLTDRGAAIVRDGKISTLTTEQGLSDNALSALYLDREGNVWIGTYYRGINRLSRQNIRFFTSANGLAADIVHPIYEDREGNVWIGGKGLTRWYEGRFGPVPGWEKLQGVTAIEQDQRGRIWFGTFNGAYYYENGKFTNFSDNFGSPQSLSDIHEDRNGALWFATTAGLFRYRDNAITQLKTNDGLASNEVKVISESRDGTLWIGTYGGLTRFKDGVLTSFTTSNGLASNLVRSLYEDKEGVLWIGSYDGGLTRLKNGNFARYTTKDGLFNDGVFQILEDSDKNLWMSCNRGIYRVTKQQLNDFAEGRITRINSTAYGKADGLLETECNGGQQPSGMRSQDGRLWFPTQGGVAVIDPREVKPNSQAPPVLIESFAANGITSTSLGPLIEVSPNTENLQIAYTGLSFIKPEQVRFKYRMSGLDRDWVDAETRRTAYFSHLPPGDYVFTVIAANSDGVWNMQGASVRVRVVPPFYRTWWFLSLVGLLVVGLALAGYRRRVTKLKRDQAAQVRFSRQLLQYQEDERKRIAGELHDGLGQNLLVIKNLALFGLAQPDSQDVARSQLGEISTTASDAIDEVRSIARNLRPYELDRLGLTLALESIVTRVAASSPITFVSRIDPIDNTFPHEAEINLYRIVQEAVNNIVKHSEATEVSLTVQREGSLVVITIRDNGKGFAPDESRAATQYESDNDLMRLRNRGFGLTGIVERVAMLNGKLSIQSSPGQGTTILVELIVPDKAPDQHEDDNE